MSNLHKIYYKEYFSGVQWRDLDSTENKNYIQRQNRQLCSSSLSVIPCIDANDSRFELKVAYPGLVTGVGISHEVKIEGEFKLGVHFDWTRGMPVVYGSSVKGVLRSAFEDGYVGLAVQQINEDANSGVHIPEWVGDERCQDLLIDDIFEGKNQGQNKSIYNRDVFFDAVIVRTDSRRHILCSDSITPHGGDNHDNPLKNPTPLTFLKIAPGCTLEFRFRLKDTTFEGLETFTAQQKLTIFKTLLATVGVGAKTRVGYGQLESL